MRPLLLQLCLLALLASAPAPAQESPHPEVWARFLGEETGLIEQIASLSEGLERGDVAAIARQFRAGKLRLLFVRQRIPLALYAHPQARALLADFLRRRSGLDLRLGLARLSGDGRSAHVAIDILTGTQLRGRARRERIVAVYERTGATWRLAEIRCP